jgi:hypothetical protein
MGVIAGMARSYGTASTFTPRANIRTRAHCRSPAEQGALIVKALEMAMDKDFVGAPHGCDRGHGPLLIRCDTDAAA